MLSKLKVVNLLLISPFLLYFILGRKKKRERKASLPYIYSPKNSPFIFKPHDFKLSNSTISKVLGKEKKFYTIESIALLNYKIHQMCPPPHPSFLCNSNFNPFSEFKGYQPIMIKWRDFQPIAKFL